MILIFIFLLTTVLVYIGIRNTSVYNYRIRLNEKVSDRARADIRQNRDWRWRYEMLNEVSYDEMMFKFWRPLDSFYPDKSFIEEGKVK